ncbi:hypothetical protein [Collimonas sp. PA-H2]|nr:hypothetical protein [Collimonas sp. PA-H2]
MLTPFGLRRSDYALHEWLGILWFKIRSGQSRQAGEVVAAS